MWIITQDGFVSLVQHNADPSLIRARARRRKHLVDTFDLTDEDVIDLGANAPDYRWHADIPRIDAAQAMLDAVTELDYTSHVKESVSGKDNDMYRAMMKCWNALYELQRPMPKPASRDWWSTNAPDTYAPGFGWDADYADPVADGPDMSVADALEIAGEYLHEDSEGDEVVEALLVLAREIRGDRVQPDADAPIADQAKGIADRMLGSDS